MIIRGPGYGAGWLAAVRSVTNFLAVRRDRVPVGRPNEEGGRVIGARCQVARCSPFHGHREQMRVSPVAPGVPVAEEQFVDDAGLNLAFFGLLQPPAVTVIVGTVGVDL